MSDFSRDSLCDTARPFIGPGAISFDDYIRMQYTPRVESAVTLEDRPTDWDRFLERAEGIEELLKAGRVLTSEDVKALTSPALHEELDQAEGQWEARIHRNEWLVEPVLGTMHIGDNFGITFIADGSDYLFVNLDCQMRQRADGKFVFGELETFVAGSSANMLTTGDAVCRRFSHPMDNATEDTDWRQLTGPQRKDLGYAKFINPGGEFIVSRSVNDPRNIVQLMFHGNQLGCLDVIRFAKVLAEKEGYLAHFGTGVKHPPYWPGILFDPRA